MANKNLQPSGFTACKNYGTLNLAGLDNQLSWWLQNRPMVSSSVDYKATLNMAIADANALGAYELLGLNKQRSVFIASPQDFEALEHGITMLIDRNRNLETALRDCVVSMQNFPLYDLPVAQSFFEQIATELNGTATLAQATLGVSL